MLFDNIRVTDGGHQLAVAQVGAAVDVRRSDREQPSIEHVDLGVAINSLVPPGLIPQVVYPDPRRSVRYPLAEDLERLFAEPVLPGSRAGVVGVRRQDHYHAKSRLVLD